MKFKFNLRQMLLCLSAGIFLLSSCATVKDIAYFQNKVVNHPEKIDKHAGIVIQAKDMLSIVVSSRNPELVTMFNLPIVSFQAGTDNVSESLEIVNTRLSIFVWLYVPSLKSVVKYAAFSMI